MFKQISSSLISAGTASSIFATILFPYCCDYRLCKMSMRNSLQIVFVMFSAKTCLFPFCSGSKVRKYLKIAVKIFWT